METTKTLNWEGEDKELVRRLLTRVKADMESEIQYIDTALEYTNHDPRQKGELLDEAQEIARHYSDKEHVTISAEAYDENSTRWCIRRLGQLNDLHR